MRFVVAPNAFKGSLDADAAARAIAKGISTVSAKASVVIHPVADGGDGMAMLLTRHLGGTVKTHRAHDALGRSIEARFGLVDGTGTALIDVAETIGLRRLDPKHLDTAAATSFGAGEAIRAALDAGADRILLGLGGSATSDMGAGLMRALGVRLLDSHGRPIAEDVWALTDVARVDCSRIDPRLSRTTIQILCDVENPLLGPSGAAAIFSPQKGATTEMTGHIERAHAAFAATLECFSGKKIAAMPMGGAAGGIAAGLHAVLDASLVAGAEAFLDETAFDSALDGASWLITGEGAIDEQTLFGKAPFAVARRARQRDISVIGLCGILPVSPSAALTDVFDAIFPIGARPQSVRDAKRQTAANLERSAFMIARTIARCRTQ